MPGEKHLLDLFRVTFCLSQGAKNTCEQELEIFYAKPEMWSVEIFGEQKCKVTKEKVRGKARFIVLTLPP